MRRIFFPHWSVGLISVLMNISRACNPPRPASPDFAAPADRPPGLGRVSLARAVLPSDRRRRLHPRSRPSPRISTRQHPLPGKMLGNAGRMFMLKSNDRAHESLFGKISTSKILRLALHGQPHSSLFLQFSSFPHRSLPSLPPDPLTPRRPSEFWPSTVRQAQKQFPSKKLRKLALDEIVVNHRLIQFRLQHFMDDMP